MYHILNILKILYFSFLFTLVSQILQIRIERKQCGKQRLLMCELNNYTNSLPIFAHIVQIVLSYIFRLSYVYL